MNTPAVQCSRIRGLMTILLLLATPLHGMGGGRDRTSKMVLNESNKANDLQYYNRFLKKERPAAPVLTGKRKKQRKRHGYKQNDPTQTITMSHMNFNELKAERDKIKAQREQYVAGHAPKKHDHLCVNGMISSLGVNDYLDRELRYLERMRKICDKPDDLAEILLHMADYHFELGQFKKADKLYHEFIDLYPGNKRNEYALYKNILCAFYQTLSADRDQTATQHAIALTDTFLEREDLFGKYKTEVTDIRSQCYTKLLESELNVCSFYLIKNQYQTIEHRIDGIRTEILPHAPELETRLLTFETETTQKKQAFEIEQARIQKIQKETQEKTLLAKQRKKQFTLEAQMPEQLAKTSKGKKPKLQISQAFD